MKRLMLVTFLAVLLASCDQTQDNNLESTDSREILRQINKTAADAEICVNDREFHFPDVIVGPKYAGNGLLQLDALVSAGLLRETEEILSEPNEGPKYLYHYKRNHLIERKSFYLTDQGLKYYRRGQDQGYFCYGHPDNVQLVKVTTTKNDEGNLVLTAIFSYDIAVNPDASWISNPWIQREFSQAFQRPTSQSGLQQFIKNQQNSIKPVSTGTLVSRYW